MPRQERPGKPAFGIDERRRARRILPRNGLARLRPDASPMRQTLRFKDGQQHRETGERAAFTAQARVSGPSPGPLTCDMIAKGRPSLS